MKIDIDEKLTSNVKSWQNVSIPYTRTILLKYLKRVRQDASPIQLGK